MRLIYFTCISDCLMNFDFSTYFIRIMQRLKKLIFYDTQMLHSTSNYSVFHKILQGDSEGLSFFEQR